MQLNDERRFFRDSLREFLEEEIAPDVEEKDQEALSKEEVIDYQTTMKEKLGIGFSPDVADEYWGDLAFYGIGSEEISRIWPSLNVTLNMSFPAMFVEYASDETKDAMMGKLESAEIIGGLAVSEPEKRHRHRASRDDRGAGRRRVRPQRTEDVGLERAYRRRDARGGAQLGDRRARDVPRRPGELAFRDE